MRQIVQATLVALAIGLFFWLLYRFYLVAFVGFIALVLHLAIRPVVDYMQRAGIPRGVGRLAVFVAITAAIMATIWFGLPLVSAQLSEASELIPDYYSRLRSVLFSVDSVFTRAFAVALPPDIPFFGGASAFAASSAVEIDPAAEQSIMDVLTSAWHVLADAAYSAAVVAAIPVLAYFLDVEGPGIVRRLLLLVPSRHRELVRTSMTEVDAKLGAYFRGQALLSLAVGIFTTAGYLLIGLPFALALGLFMSIMEAVPLVGPVIGAIPAILVAATMSPDNIIWVIIVVVVVQVLEGNLLVPKIMGESVGVHPIAMILAIAAFGAIFGVVGVIVAVPLAATLQVIAQRYIEDRPLANDSDIDNGVGTDRGALGALRFRTQELYQDLRKSSRSTLESDQNAGEVAEWEDRLESIAVDLERLLRDMDQKE